jgi:hypothetical protein
MTTVTTEVGTSNGIKLTLDVHDGPLELRELNQIATDLDFVAHASAVWYSEGDDRRGFIKEPVRVLRISYNSPFTIVLVAAAGTGSLMAFLAFLRDWTSTRQSKRDDVDFKKDVYDQMRAHLEKEGVSTDDIYAIASNLFGGSPTRPDILSEQATKVAIASLERLGSLIRKVEPTDEI